MDNEILQKWRIEAGKRLGIWFMNHLRREFNSAGGFFYQTNGENKEFFRENINKEVTMTPIHLKDIQKGQVFYEQDGPFLAKCTALEDARRVIKPGQLRNGFECRVLVDVGDGEASEMTFYESVNAGGYALRLFDSPPPWDKRFNLDIPNPYPVTGPAIINGKEHVNGSND